MFNKKEILTQNEIDILLEKLFKIFYKVENNHIIIINKKYEVQK